MLELSESWHGLLDLIYPPQCISCHQSIGFISQKEKDLQLCHYCQSTIVKNTPPFCKKCSRPLKNHELSFCKICRHNPLHFDHAWAASIYTDAMKRLLYLFKYGHKTALRHFFWELMNVFSETYHLPLDAFDYCVPVPLHAARLRERGFNQSQLISQMLSETFCMPHLPHYLYRTRPTQNQARLSPKERWTNIRSAFRMKHSHIFHRKNILIIDDLYTTGATTSEIARIFKENGANKVGVFTLAIAV